MGATQSGESGTAKPRSKNQGISTRVARDCSNGSCDNNDTNRISNDKAVVPEELASFLAKMGMSATDFTELNKKNHGSGTSSSDNVDEWEDWIFLQSKINEYVAEHGHNPTRVSEAQQNWIQRGGQELESVLQSGAIALLDAQWLVNYVRAHDKNNGNDKNKHANETETPVVRLPCRQELPKDAFVSYNDVAASTSRLRSTGLQIIALSHMWLHPSHPDPQGTTLRLLASWCQERLRESRKSAFLGHFPRWAVFWDYASLYQHPDPARGRFRTKQEDDLFREGLKGLAALFSHPHTHCYKVTEFPKGYPEEGGYSLPSGSNCAGYHQRGWTFVENCLVSLTKSGGLVRDISHDDPEREVSIAKSRAAAGSGATQKANEVKNDDGPTPELQNPFTTHRQAPLTPEQLNEHLHTLSFTNAKDDRPLVSELYRNEFERRLGQVHELDLRGLSWDDTHIRQLSHVISEGYTPNLQCLLLGMNQFGSSGCLDLSDALMCLGRIRETVKLSSLKKIDFSNNVKIGDAEIEVLAPVLVQVHTVGLDSMGLGASVCQSLAKAAAGAVENGTLRLRKLSMLQNPNIGSRGVRLLAPVIVPHMEEVCFSKCSVGDDGCKALADVASSMKGADTSPLILMSMNGNPAIQEEGYAHTGRLLAKCPKLKRLVIRNDNDSGLFEQHEPMLKASCPNSKLAIN